MAAPQLFAASVLVRHRGTLAVAAAITPVSAVATILLVLGGAGANGQPPVPGCAGGGTGQQVAGLRLDPEQMGNAHTIVSVTAARRFPAYGAVVAVATAIQESRLRNSPVATDHDSVGLFQQRPSQGWGTLAQLIDPVYATNAFLDRMLTVPGWELTPLTEVAADVQNPRADLRGAYAHWQGIAQMLVNQFWPTALTAASLTSTQAGRGDAANVGVTHSSDAVVAPAAPVCPGGGGAGGSDTIVGRISLPAGLVITGTAQGRAAVAFALAQLGKPYIFGAAGPDAWDCSGLTMAAWASAGIALPHWTVTQAQAGAPEPVDLSAAVGGDLVLIPGADGTAQAPGHVGMVVGYDTRPDGRHLWLIQAPTPGRDVELTEATAWRGQIVTVRHIA